MNRWTAAMAALGRSLSGLTQAERRLLCVIAALALLGLGVKWWAHHAPDRPVPGPVHRTESE